jgi:hypothetical protein
LKIKFKGLKTRTQIFWSPKMIRNWSEDMSSIWKTNGVDDIVYSKKQFNQTRRLGFPGLGAFRLFFLSLAMCAGLAYLALPEMFFFFFNLVDKLSCLVDCYSAAEFVDTIKETLKHKMVVKVLIFCNFVLMVLCFNNIFF